MEAGKRSAEIATKYGVQSLPTIAFISPTGRLIDRVSGFQGPGPFPGTLRRSSTRSSDVIGSAAWFTNISCRMTYAEFLAPTGRQGAPWPVSS